jgi:rubrerythrin
MKPWQDEVRDHEQRAAQLHAKRKSSINRSLALALQLPGVLLLLIGLASAGWLFIIPGLLLILLGSSMCRRWVCGHCGNKVEKTSSMCPVCRALLS